MKKNHAKAIKGLSIACLVVSSLLLYSTLVGTLFTAIFAPVLLEFLTDYVMESGMDLGTLSTSPYEAIMGLEFALNSTGLFLFLTVCASAVLLAASIIVLINVNRPEKYGMCFVWSIVGVVLGFITSGIVLGVLFILVAVFVNSDKKLYESNDYITVPPLN